MTGEEAKKEIIDMANALQLIPNTPKGKAVSMALKALEQEPVLGKIRAEIESIERYGTVNGHDIWLRTPEEIKKEVLKIIDKYKAESEE